MKFRLKNAGKKYGTASLCLFSCISALSRVTGVSNEASENMVYLKLEVNQKTATQVLP